MTTRRAPLKTRPLRLLATALAATAAVAVAGCGSKPTTTYKQPPGADSYVKAVTALKAGNEERAIDDLERAVIKNPSLRMARMTLGELYITRREYDKALPHLQAASELDPYTLRNHYNLGLSYQVLNRLQEAAMAYIRGIRLAPDDFKTNMNLGLVYFALGQLDPAIYYLERATRVEPDNARAWSNIGVVYDARGNLILAEASYRKSLELDPTSESTLTNLTSNLIGQRKSTDAVAVARQLVAAHDSPLARKRMGDAYTAAGQWDEAVAAYDACLAADANFLPALNAKAEMFARRYDVELRLDDKLRQQALALWQQSLKLNPDQPNVTRNVTTWTDPKLFKK